MPKSIEVIEKLLQRFGKVNDKRIISLKNEFDKRAWHVARNFMNNDRLVFLLEKNKPHQIHNEKYDDAFLNRIDEIIVRIDNNQHETKILNYYPYLKYANWLCDLIDCSSRIDDRRYFTHNNDLIKYEQFLDSLFERLQRIFSCMIERYNWCKINYFVPFQVEYKDCIIPVKTDGVELSLFSSSSYFLPINYLKLQNEVNDLTIRYHTIKNSIHYYKSLNRLLIESKQLKDDVLKNDKKHIEILGIFTAIMAFFIGGAGLLKRLSSFTDAASLVLLYTYSIISFILLIWFVSRESRFRLTARHYIVAAFCLIATYLTISFVMHIWPFVIK